MVDKPGATVQSLHHGDTGRAYLDDGDLRAFRASNRRCDLMLRLKSRHQR